ncbi:MAG: hypothetical protein KJ060_00205, partial [Candidatus Hydrogenedentes bacterium]|nr:hypothetical protein [Candidatus Hydrogenedentota bacterium]
GNESQPTSSRPAKTRIALGCLLVVLVCIAGTYFGLGELRSRSRAASCPNDVWHVYVALKYYAESHDGAVPPISKIRGNLMIEPAGFYPEYLDNSCWVQCEWSSARRPPSVAHKNDDLGVDAFNDDSFCYLPWAIRSEEEGLAFIEAYKTLDLETRDEDLVVTIDGEQRVLPRIKLTREALLEYGGHWKVPILIEWPGLNHRGGTVYYVGGRADVLTLGRGFPMTDAVISGLRAIASLDHPVPE